MKRGRLRSVRPHSATARSARQATRRQRQAEADRIAEGRLADQDRRRERLELKRLVRVVKDIAPLSRQLENAIVRSDRALLAFAEFIAHRLLNEDLEKKLHTGTTGLRGELQ